MNHLGIAVLCYNQPHLVGAMYEQIGEELIVVDNGSTVPLPRGKMSHIILMENGYFAGGWNDAMTVLKAYPWVAMLNSDIEGVSPNMFYELVETAQLNDLSAISPAFNSPHAHMQPQGKGLREVSWLDWTAVVLHTDHWLGFNAHEFPGYGADLDLAYRMKQQGYRMAVDDRHQIHHQGSATALAEGLQDVQGNVGKMDAAFDRLYGVPNWMHFISRYLP